MHVPPPLPPPPPPPAHLTAAASETVQVEDPKRALLVYGNKTSQVVKDVMTDLHKLKGVRSTAAAARRVLFVCLLLPRPLAGNMQAPACLQHAASRWG